MSTSVGFIADPTVQGLGSMLVIRNLQ